MSVDGYGHAASHGALTGLDLDHHPQYALRAAVAIEDIVATDTSVPDKTWTWLLWNGGALRNDGGWTVASGSSDARLVVPVTGWYVVSTHFGWAISTAGSRRIQRITHGVATASDGSGVNTVEIARNEVLPGASPNVVVPNLSGVVYLLAGEEIGVAVYQDSGGALNAGNIGTSAKFSAAKVA